MRLSKKKLDIKYVREMIRKPLTLTCFAYARREHFFSFLHPSMRETTISQSPHNRQLNPKRAKFPTTKTKALIN